MYSIDYSLACSNVPIFNMFVGYGFVIFNSASSDFLFCLPDRN